MKDLIAFIGLSTMVGLTLLMFVIFATAYTSPAKAVRLDIDNYGEAHFEMIMLAALLPVQLFAAVAAGRRLGEGNVRAKEEMEIQ